jgi:ribosomal protein L11
MNIICDKINFNKFNSKFLEKLELKEINKIFKFYIPSQNAKIKSVWAPTLTPYLNKEKLNEFCDLYNKFILYKKDILIPVYFILYANKSFDFVLRTPNLFHLLKYLLKVDKVLKLDNKQIYYITYEELYWFILIKNNYDDNNIKYLFKILINRLKDFNIKIIKK